MFYVPDKFSKSLHKEEALIPRGPLQLWVVAFVQEVVPEWSNVRESLQYHVAVVVRLKRKNLRLNFTSTWGVFTAHLTIILKVRVALLQKLTLKNWWIQNRYYEKWLILCNCQMGTLWFLFLLHFSIWIIQKNNIIFGYECGTGTKPILLTNEVNKTEQNGMKNFHSFLFIIMSFC